MKIAVDGYYLNGKVRGMARYAQMLYDSLPESDRIMLPFAGEASDIFYSGSNAFFPLWEQLFLPSRAKNLQADLLLCPYNTGPIWLSSLPNILVVYDLIFMENDLDYSTSSIQNMGRKYRRFVVPKAVLRARHILTCSEHTKRQIIDSLGVSGEKITVIPFALADEWFDPAPRLPASDPYLLAVGGEVPSKNCHRLLQAMRLVIKQKPGLVLKLVGIKQKFHSLFQNLAVQLGIEDNVQLMPRLSEELLRATYANAAAFVCPSLFEGFGIPLLEAMASGIPIASSNTTSLPEVAGKCAIYFDPLDIDAMAEAILISLDGSAATKARVDDGIIRAREFSRSAILPRLGEFWRDLQ